MSCITTRLRNLMNFLALVIATGLFLSAGACSSHPSESQPGVQGRGSPIPYVSNVIPPLPYDNLYSQLQTIVKDADAAISKQWDGTKYPVIYSSWMLSANSNAAISILNSGFSLASAQKEIDGLRALGVQGITVEIGYPVFDRGFYAFLGKDPALADQFLSYYRSVAAYVRQSGMKLIVEANPLLTVSIANSGGALDPTAFYKALTLEKYEAGRSAHNALVADQIRPDYLSIQTEPDTEARDVQNAALSAVFSNPAADVAMVGRTVASLNNAGIPGLHTSTKLGAGAGPWLPNWQQYVDGFAAIDGLDVIETHLYNLQPSLDEINRIEKMADIAHAANKAVGMAEFWPHKSLDVSDSIFDIRARDSFSFWAPLDQQFLELMMKLANYKKFEYVSPTGWLHLFNYLDYGSIPCIPVFPASVPTPNRACDEQLQTLQIRGASQALNKHTATETGSAYKRLVAQYSK